MKVMADLLEVSDVCIGDLVKETRRVLEDDGYPLGIAPVRFRAPADLLTFLASNHTPQRTRIIQQLSHPALTGLTRAELDQLTQRVVARQAAQNERLAYQRRGAPRQPGTRGGVFPQKIGNTERVLLTILYQRGLCTLNILAEALGDVSRSSIGNVIRETQPLLRQEGHKPTPAPTRYHTATDLLAATTSHNTTT